MHLEELVGPALTAALAPWLWGGALAALLVATVLGALEAHRGRAPRASLALSAASTVAIAGLGLLLLLPGAVPFTAAVGQVLDFQPIDVRYDALAAVFVVALGVVALAVTIAAWEGVQHAPFNAMTGAAYPAFLASMLLVFGATDGFAFLLAWELMALSSAALVVGAKPVHEQVSAGYLYLAVTHLATAALVVAFAILASAAGGSLAFGDWAVATPSLAPLARDAVFVLLLLGFGTKAGAIPLHVWLPRAHPAAPAHVSALMSGIMIKTGIFGLVRIGVEVLGPGPDGWGGALLLVGGVSAVLGVLYALMEHDLKRLLAFSSVENIGIILLGLGAAMVLAGHGLAAAAGVALAAALFHTLNHGMFKALLFLGAGAVQAAAGSRNLNRLGGLVRGMPRTALLFGIGAAAISGLPPLNGFSSEWLTFHGLIGAGAAPDLPPWVRSIAFVAVGALALTAALAVAAFVKATGMTFLALPRSAGAGEAREAAWSERIGMTILAASCVALGLAAAPVAARLGEIGAGVTRVPAAAPAVALGADPLILRGTTVTGAGLAGDLAPAILALFAGLAVSVSLLAVRRGRRREVVRTAPTWTCGIVPAPAMEYTSTSYSKLLRLFFRRILLPEREIRIEYHPGTPLPTTIHYSGGVTHVLEQRVFGPLHGLSVRASSTVRRLQNGSVQAYLAYALVGFVLLLVVAR